MLKFFLTLDSSAKILFEFCENLGVEKAKKESYWLLGFGLIMEVKFGQCQIVRNADLAESRELFNIVANA